MKQRHYCESPCLSRLKETTYFHLFFTRFVCVGRLFQWSNPIFNGLFCFCLNIWIQTVSCLMQVPVFCFFLLFVLQNAWLLCVHLVKLFKQEKRKNVNLPLKGSDLTGTASGMLLYPWGSLCAMEPETVYCIGCGALHNQHYLEKCCSDPKSFDQMQKQSYPLFLCAETHM